MNAKLKATRPSSGLLYCWGPSMQVQYICDVSVSMSGQRERAAVGLLCVTSSRYKFVFAVEKLDGCVGKRFANCRKSAGLSENYALMVCVATHTCHRSPPAFVLDC